MLGWALDQLDEHPAGAAGVQEGNEVPAGSGPGLFVDELEARFLEASQVGRNVVRLVGDMMEAGTATFQESGYAGVGGQGLDEFQLPHEQDPDSLGLDGLRVGGRGAGQEFEEAAGLFK